MELKVTQVDSLAIQIYDSRDEMGKVAADNAIIYIKQLLKEKEEINILFAAAPSQNEFLKYLIQKDIDWSKVNALHMDEYIGLPEDAPQRFGYYLNKHLFSLVNFKSVHYLYQNGTSAEEMCTRYENLLKKYPLDIVCMGIGENGHIAFNDPHVAAFDDVLLVKTVSLDEKCRLQQVHDGCFPSLDEVPLQAITVTIPVMMQAKKIFCIVPGNSKSNAILHTLTGEITSKCPASVLRMHKGATLFCDKESAASVL